MRRPGTQFPIARYTIPPDPPAEVVQTAKTFDTVADRWAAVKGAVSDAREAVTLAEAKDIEAIAEAAKNGKDVKNPTEHKDAATLALSDMEARRRGLDSALDEAGNELALAIHTERAEWLTRLTEVEAEAAETFDEAVTLAREAFARLRAARGGREWVEAFDLGRARAAEVPQFAGGRIRVEDRGSQVLKGEFDPADLLALAARATAPPEPSFAEVKAARKAARRATEPAAA